MSTEKIENFPIIFKEIIRIGNNSINVRFKHDTSMLYIVNGNLLVPLHDSCITNLFKKLYDINEINFVKTWPNKKWVTLRAYNAKVDSDKPHGSVSYNEFPV